MKEFVHIPVEVIRIAINKQGCQAEYLTLCECTSEEVEQRFKDVIEKQGLSPFQTGKVTSINIREAIGAANGKARSISFKGLEPAQVVKLFKDSLNHKI